MYQFLVSFTVPAEHHDGFVAAARQVARDSIANEPGSQRFEVIADETNPDVIYLNEVYDDVDAFNVHASGPYFAEFFEKAGRIAEGPVWLMKGRTLA